MAMHLPNVIAPTIHEMSLASMPFRVVVEACEAAQA